MGRAEMGETAVLITRPEPDGAAFAEALRAARPGPWRAVLSPLTRVAALALPPLPEGAALVLTSRNAARALGGAGRGMTAWCVGSATAEAALAAGLVPVGVGEGGSEALVALIAAAGPAGPLVHLRGRESRGDVAARLRALGLEASEAVIYDQLGEPPSAEAAALLGGPARVVAPVFSPRGAARLRAVLPPGRAVEGVAISRAAADALGAASVARAPDLAAMIEAVGGLLPTRAADPARRPLEARGRPG